jgi:hypothetical protein
MNKFILTMVMAFSFSAQSAIYLPYCFNFGDGVSPSYQSCVSNNLRKVGAELEMAYVPACYYYGSINAYTSCVNSAFMSLGYKTEGNVYMGLCLNFGDKLGASYTSCVQQNFVRLGIYVNGLDSSKDMD